MATSPSNAASDPPASSPSSSLSDSHELDLASGLPVESTAPVERRKSYFETRHLQTGLRGRAVRGGAIALVSQVLRLGLLAVLARLLAIDDFGIMAKVLAVTGFVTMFREAGLATATVQRDQITHAQISTLFWVNLVFGGAAAVIIAALAPLLVLLYDDDRVLPITLALAVPVLLAGLPVQHMALLRRQMRFGRIAVIELGSLVLGIVGAVVAAIYGAGYWAFVVQQYGAALSQVVLTLVLCSWRPGRLRRGTGVRPMLAFGGNLTGSSLCAYLIRNADNILIGRFVGDAALGFYSMAYRLLMLPLQSFIFPLTGVAQSTLSRLQDQPGRYQRYYYDAIGLIVSLSLPTVAFSLVEAPHLIELVLGPKWIDAASIFRALGPAALMGTFGVATGWVYTSLGRTDRQLRWNAFATIVHVAAFIVGLTWGVLGVATAFSLVQVVLRPPAIMYCYRGTFLSGRRLVGKLSRPMVASLGAGAGVVLVRELVEPAWHVTFELGAAFVVYVLMYFGLWLIMPGGRAELIAMSRAGQAARSAV